MKEYLKKITKNKYFKIALVGLVLIIVGLISYLLFISNHVIFRENEQLFLEGLKKYYDYEPTKLPSEGNFRKVGITDLYEKGWLEALYVPNSNRLCSEESYIRTVKENGEYRYIVYLECGKYKSNIDTESPEIILNGDDSVVTPLNATYQDLGVKEVKDNVDKIDVSKVKVDTSDVNTSVSGTYEVTYLVYDNNFNSKKVTRKVIVAETFSDRIKRDKGENYRYVGDADDNYVLFSGMMFRIVKAGEDVMLITDNTISNLAYSKYDVDYSESNVYKWLNNYFLTNINENSKKYIIDSMWCYDDKVSITDADTCNKQLTAKVGLLNVSDYQQSKTGDLTYLATVSRFYMLNRYDSQNVWISDIYGNTLRTMDTTSLVGVRPVINISGGIYVTGGNGTYENPYKLQDYTYAKENDKLNSRLIGEYVTYSGYNFRIAGVDKDGNTKLISTDLLYNTSDNITVGASYDNSLESIAPNALEEGNLYYDLYNNALNYLSSKSIVTGLFEIPILDMESDYDVLKTTKLESKIGLPASYEMFSGLNKLSGTNVIYWLSDYRSDNKVTILNGNNGVAFYLNRDTFPSNAVKPVIYVDKTLKIASGRGSVSNPYYVR